MNSKCSPEYAITGLQFFGKMTASVSHEVKNCLSIMNENAGLLQDLVLLNQKGKPLEPERVNRIAAQIVGQVKRADDIVKNLNQFAHSVDEPTKQADKQIDLGELLSLSIALAQRTAANRGVTINLLLPQETITVATHPFFLMQAAWNCLDFAMDMAGDSKEITIEVRLANDNIAIAFQNIGALSDQDRTERFRKRTDTILSMLGGQLLVSEDQTEISLVFSREQEI